jgi:hypothetical protein
MENMNMYNVHGIVRRYNSTVPVHWTTVDMYVVSSKHCTENLKHLFQEMKLRGLLSNFYIHVPVSDLHIPMIGPQQTFILDSHRPFICSEVTCYLTHKLGDITTQQILIDRKYLEKK